MPHITIGAGAVIFALALSGLSSSPDPSSQAYKDAEACRPISVVDVKYLDAQGHASASWSRGNGLVVTYATENGTSRRAMIMPAGITGDTATPGLLRAMGLPTTSDPDSARLRHSMRGGGALKTKPETPTICMTNRTNSATSSNWSGRVVTNYTNSTNVSGAIIVPTYTSACAHASAHSTWVGFGGWYSNSPGLIQAGIDTSRSAVNAVFPFYEVYPKEHEVKVSSPATSPGQRLEVLVGYHGNGESSFSFYNTTTGVSVTYSEGSTASYVDGRSAEWIDERPANNSLSYPVDGQYYYYRKSTNVSWSSEKIRGGLIGTIGTNVTMTRPNGVTLGTAALGSSKSTDAWKACA